MEIPFLTGALLVALLVGANAFFVAAEFALVALRRTRVEELVREGDRLAKAVQAAQADLDRSISGTQLGITLASLGLGWIGEPVVARTIDAAFAGVPSPWSAVLTHSVAAAIAFAFITFLHIVLGELAPKSLALLSPEAVSRWVALPLNVFNTIASPFIHVLNGASALVLRAFGLRPAGTHELVHSPEEIQMLLRQSRREGVVEQDEEAMIHGVFELTHTVAREVMTPRPDIVAVPETATLDEVLEVAGESGFSRLPVYRGSIDEISGIALVKDLLPWLRRPDRSGFDLRQVMRPPYFVPDTKPVDDLLTELRHHKVHMAVVVDEFGGTDGIVSLEDVLEEIVGDIYDEHDVPEAEIAVLPDGRIVVDGGAALADLVGRFELRPPSEEYDTVAGYVIGQLGRIPEAGEAVRIGDAELLVLETADRRVTRLELKRRPAGASASRAGGDAG